MVGNCGHDLVGFVGLIWWVSVVLGDGFDGVEIRVGGWSVLWWQRWRFCGGFFAVVCGSGFGLVWGVGCGSPILGLCV